jgi:Ca-activated chloride channel homolog
MHIESDRALVPSQIPSVRHLTVTITAPPRRQPARERPPVHVSLVLDRSGSMAGRKIDMARKAVAHAITLLDSRDQLAVVVYDDQIDTILEATGATREAKKTAQDELGRIDARGSTDLAGGWFRGVEQTVAHAGSGTDPRPRFNVVRRVLLLTDGLANVGITDHSELQGAAAKFREQGIATSTFGVGADFDEALLASIATRGGGYFYFIEKAKQIRRPDVAADRRRWRETQSLHKCVSDECGVTTDLLRRYGRSPRGTRLHDHTPCSHWQTHTVVAALRLDGLTVPSRRAPAHLRSRL